MGDFARLIKGRRVFLTGHTGFKGSWLTFLLKRCGCEVSGYSLSPTAPSLFLQAQMARQLATHHVADVRDAARLNAAMQAAKPELVIHMAAQSLVRPGYKRPVETWATNVMGTVHVLEAVRALPNV